MKVRSVVYVCCSAIEKKYMSIFASFQDDALTVSIPARKGDDSVYSMSTSSKSNFALSSSAREPRHGGHVPAATRAFTSLRSILRTWASRIFSRSGSRRNHCNERCRFRQDTLDYELASGTQNEREASEAKAMIRRGICRECCRPEWSD